MKREPGAPKGLAGVALVHEARVGFRNPFSYAVHSGSETLPPASIDTLVDPSNRRGKKKREPGAQKGPAGVVLIHEKRVGFRNPCS